MQYTQLSRRSAGGKLENEKQYLTFIPVENAVFSWTERAASGHLEYSLNGGQTWVTITSNTSTPVVSAGNKIMWRGDLVPTTTSSGGGIGVFSSTANYDTSGSVMSLLYGDDFSEQLVISGSFTFANLFYSDTHLLSAPELPATTLATYCYFNMFRGCTSLVIAPELPATTLAGNCYNTMFRECTSLTTAPELPATTLANACYKQMFYGCTSLATAPELPATTLTANCYDSMFRECTSLTTAPELPATTLVKYCYWHMFRDCTSLATAPELPATTLVSSCYYYMFRDCTSLSYIKCLATYVSANMCTTSWVQNVAATGTFVKAASMASWSTGSDGIPSGWTVLDNNS